MAYSNSKYQLSRLLQDAWNRMGQMRTWLVTGGSTTTVVNTDWAIPEEPVFEDDDPALILGTVVVIEDAGGLGAAPEGEFGMITDYDSASSTVTMDALTTAVASGDRVGIATPLFPLQDMIQLANIALRKIGELDLLNTSLSFVAGQLDYTLPSSIRKPITRVRYTPDNLYWYLVSGWSVKPATAGTNWTLTLPNLPVNSTIEVMYRDFHPAVNSYEDDIIETIHPELAVNALVAEAYQWYNNQVGGSNQYFLQRENKAIQDLEASKVMYPVHRDPGQVQGLPHWNTRGKYVPLTSDLAGG